jgi:hypothetical protein
VSARLVALAVFLLVSAAARRPAACDADTEQWVARCSAEERIVMKVTACPPGLAIVSVDDGTPEGLRVEVSRGRPAFHKSGDYGFSPIGDFPEWDAEPEARRRSFDALVSCASRRQSPTLPTAAHPPTLRVPWLLLGASIAAIAMLASLRRRRLMRHAAIAVGAAVAIVVVRAAFGFAFFHEMKSSHSRS